MVGGCDSPVRLVCGRRWAEFVPALDRKCIVLAPWCERIACEEIVKERTKATGEPAKAEEAPAGEEAGEDAALGPRGLTGAAKTLCIPFEQAEIPAGMGCFCCEEPASAWALWGRSY
jgi:prolyl-tRNA synthetase